MKRVSFKVAKALKEAGYPQGDGQYFAEDGLIVTKDKDTKFLCRYYIPNYLDVWLWLWREKKIAIDVDKYSGYSEMFFVDITINNLIIHTIDNINDPEEAIIAAIEYIVDNDLIK